MSYLVLGIGWCHFSCNWLAEPANDWLINWFVATEMGIGVCEPGIRTPIYIFLCVFFRRCLQNFVVTHSAVDGYYSLTLFCTESMHTSIKKLVILIGCMMNLLILQLWRGSLPCTEIALLCCYVIEILVFFHACHCNEYVSLSVTGIFVPRI